jgi:hypothetical protein
MNHLLLDIYKAAELSLLLIANILAHKVATDSWTHSFSSLLFLLMYINCTKGFHCDIPIHAYKVL